MIVGLNIYDLKSEMKLKHTLKYFVISQSCVYLVNFETCYAHIGMYFYKQSLSSLFVMLLSVLFLF